MFLDESGAKTNMTRLRGRAPRGQRGYAHSPHGHYFLDCGDLERGFARVRCDDGKREFLLAHACLLEHMRTTLGLREGLPGLVMAIHTFWLPMGSSSAPACCTACPGVVRLVVAFPSALWQIHHHGNAVSGRFERACAYTPREAISYQVDAYGAAGVWRVPASGRPQLHLRGTDRRVKGCAA